MSRMEVKFIFYHYLYVPISCMSIKEKMTLIFQNIMRMHTVFFLKNVNLPLPRMLKFLCARFIK